MSQVDEHVRGDHGAIFNCKNLYTAFHWISRLGVGLQGRGEPSPPPCPLLPHGDISTVQCMGISDNSTVILVCRQSSVRTWSWFRPKYPQKEILL